MSQIKFEEFLEKKKLRSVYVESDEKNSIHDQISGESRSLSLNLLT